MQRQPNILKNDNVVFFDVDDTLVMWSWPEQKDNETIVISAAEEPALHNIRVWPHKEHANRLKQFKARGQSVVVWSQGGWAWAKAVVEALGLQLYVDAIMTKPKWIFDDLPASAWLNESHRSYVDPVTGKTFRQSVFEPEHVKPLP